VSERLREGVQGPAGNNWHRLGGLDPAEEPNEKPPVGDTSHCKADAPLLGVDAPSCASGEAATALPLLAAGEKARRAKVAKELEEASVEEHARAAP